MIYEHRSSVGNKGFPLPIKIVGIFSVIIFLIYFIFPNFISGLVIFIVSPFWNFEKNITAPDKNTPSELQSVMVSELITENDFLKKALHKTATSTAPYFSYILKKPPYTVYDSYIIDVSNYKDISVGDRVFAIGNILLGEVVEKNKTYAKVKLYSSHDEKFDVFIGSNNIQATAVGLGGGAFEVVLPKDSKVKVGDAVTIPNLEVSIFGIVKNVGTTLSSISNNLFIKSLY
jgi:cell shape-determining protein MreC